MTPRELAERSGIPEGQISRYRRGSEFRVGKVPALARALRLDESAFIRGVLVEASADPPSFDVSGSLRRIPVLALSEACAGGWRGVALDEGRKTIIADAPDDETYAVRVPDRRMSPRYEEGEVVILSPRARVERDACVLAATKSGRCVLARWREIEGRVILGALHPDFEAVVVRSGDVAFAHRIVGTRT